MAGSHLPWNTQDFSNFNILIHQSRDLVWMRKDTFVSLASGIWYKVDYHTNGSSASRSISLIGHGPTPVFFATASSLFAKKRYLNNKSISWMIFWKIMSRRTILKNPRRNGSLLYHRLSEHFVLLYFISEVKWQILTLQNKKIRTLFYCNFW